MLVNLTLPIRNTHKCTCMENSKKNKPEESVQLPEAGGGNEVPQAEESAPPSKTPKRDALRARLKKKYPDMNMDDDESFAGRISDDYDESEKRLKQYEDDEKSMSDFFMSDPKAYRFLSSWKEGKHPVLSMVNEYGLDFMDYLDDPEHQEEIAEANKQYLDRVAKDKQLEDDYQKNLQESLDRIEKYQKEHGLDDDYVDKGVGKIFKIVNDAIMGIIYPQDIEILNKGENHDNDVASAREAGIVNGRNAKIEEKLRKENASDGTAHLGGGGNAPLPKPAQKRARTIFDEANEAM